MKPSKKFPYGNADEYRAWWATQTDVPYGKCWCGCGGETIAASKTRSECGVIAGCQHRYINGHNARHRPDGKRISLAGYVEIYRPHHPGSCANGSIQEHRYIMEIHLGRCLDQDETIHHINGNKQDNRIANLLIIPRGEHSSLHSRNRYKTPYTYESIMAHLANGLNYKDIAQIYGRAPNSVAEYMLRRGFRKSVHLVRRRGDHG